MLIQDTQVLLSVTTNKTGTETGSPVILLVSPSKIIFQAILNISVYGSGDARVVIYDSLDGTNWRTLYTFAAKSAVASTVQWYMPSKDTLLVMPRIKGEVLVSDEASLTYNSALITCHYSN